MAPSVDKVVDRIHKLFADSYACEATGFLRGVIIRGDNCGNNGWNFGGDSYRRMATQYSRGWGDGKEIEIEIKRLNDLASKDAERLEKEFEKLGLNAKQAQAILHSLNNGPDVGISEGEPPMFMRYRSVLQGTVENNEVTYLQKLGLGELAQKLKRRPPLLSGIARLFSDLPWFCLNMLCECDEENISRELQFEIVGFLGHYPEYSDQISQGLRNFFYERQEWVVLGYLGDPRAIQPLAERLPDLYHWSSDGGDDGSGAGFLGDHRKNWQNVVTMALERIGIEAVPALIQILRKDRENPNKEHHWLQVSIITALGNLRDSRVVPLLTQIIQEEEDTSCNENELVRHTGVTSSEACSRRADFFFTHEAATNALKKIQKEVP